MPECDPTTSHLDGPAFSWPLHLHAATLPGAITQPAAQRHRIGQGVGAPQNGQCDASDQPGDRQEWPTSH